MGEDQAQENADRFYWERGPCCAGCDYWRGLNSVAGECQRSRLIPGGERAAMLGIHGCSLSVGAGHALTPRDYWCGNFRDAFDWLSLPPAYLRIIGHRASMTPLNASQVPGRVNKTTPTLSGEGEP